MSPVYIQKSEKNVSNLHKIKQRLTIRLFDCIQRERQPMQKLMCNRLLEQICCLK